MDKKPDDLVELKSNRSAYGSGSSNKMHLIVNIADENTKEQEDKPTITNFKKIQEDMNHIAGLILEPCITLRLEKQM